MTNKKTKHTTPDGTTFKVGDTIVEVDRDGNPIAGTIGVVQRITKTLMKAVKADGLTKSYKLSRDYNATDIGDIRLLTDDYRYLLRTGASERGHYGAVHNETIRLLENAHRRMHNRSVTYQTIAPDPVEAYKLLKQAQSQLNKAIAGIEKEVVDDWEE